MPYQDDNSNGYILPPKSTNKVSPDDNDSDAAAAVDLIRQKINSLYEAEPAAKTEASIAEDVPVKQRSKHQAFMHELSKSGKSLAEIQIAWHQYYKELPDHEKHEVWQEFYTEHGSNRHNIPQLPKVSQSTTQHQAEVTNQRQPIVQALKQPSTKNFPKRSAGDMQQRIRTKVSQQSSKQKSNLKSLLFGLSMGGLVLLIATFSFFNERFIAPFITPSRVLSSTPLIIDENTPVGDEPKIIIPKINVEIPVVYGEESIQEDAVQRALEDGVLHYPTTAEPGEKGNSVFFGHSSNNILNRGKYKFAFVLLNQLEEGDTFMLEKDKTRYIYQVFDTRVVPPSDLSVLQPNDDHSSVATLITCDPPGTAINRLVVTGKQISPDPIDNSESSAPALDERPQPETLPSDSPSLWSRLFGS
jgi:sortase A